jgi:hypothetical protein
MDLLYLCAYWHSLAKLRMHTDSSLKVMEQATVQLCQALRYFAKVTCQAFTTVETPKEYAARGRAEARRSEKTAGGPTATSAVADVPALSI